MSRSVVIVDDEESIRILVGRVAQRKGYQEIFYAPNGIDGYSTIEREHPDVIVTDVNMPRGDGISMMERVRGIEGYTPGLVVVMSGRDLPEAKSRLGSSYQYIEKPDIIDPLMRLL